MKLLAFDTSTSACSVAVCDNGKVKQSHHDVPMQHGKMLLSMIKSLLTEAQIELTELDAIVYGAGPGSYTGSRIASSACQALAFAILKPVIRISSLHALAQTAWLHHKWQHVLVLQDARMGQIYCAYYALQDGYMQPQLADSILSPDELANHISQPIIITHNNQQIYAVGDGLPLFSPALLSKLGINIGQNSSQITPHAVALLELGKICYDQGRFLRPEEAQPIYLR